MIEILKSMVNFKEVKKGDFVLLLEFNNEGMNKIQTLEGKVYFINYSPVCSFKNTRIVEKLKNKVLQARDLNNILKPRILFLDKSEFTFLSSGISIFSISGLTEMMNYTQEVIKQIYENIDSISFEKNEDTDSEPFDYFCRRTPDYLKGFLVKNCKKYIKGICIMKKLKDFFERIIFNGKTTITYASNKKVIVTCSKDDEHDPTVAMALSFAYHSFGGKRKFKELVQREFNKQAKQHLKK